MPAKEDDEESIGANREDKQKEALLVFLWVECDEPRGVPLGLDHALGQGIVVLPSRG